MKTKEKSKLDYKPRVWATLMVVFSLVVYFLFYTQIKNERALAEKVVRDNAVRENQEAFRNRLKQGLDNTKEDRAMLEAHFVRQAEIVDFIEGLEKLGKDIGVEAHISSLNESFSAATSGKLGLSLQVSGSIDGVYKYLLLLEQVPQKIDISSVSLQASAPASAPTTKKQAAGSQPVTWTAEIRADVVHYLK